MDMEVVKNHQAAFQEELQKYQQYVAKIQELRVPTTKLMTQVAENGLTKKELDELKDDASVYKLLGPVMIRQELSDSRMNVDSRIKFLRNELRRHEEQLKEAQSSSEKSQRRLGEISDEIRKLQQLLSTANADSGRKAHNPRM